MLPLGLIDTSMLRQLAWNGKFWRKEASDFPKFTQKTRLIPTLAFEKALGMLRQDQGFVGLQPGQVHRALCSEGSRAWFNALLLHFEVLNDFRLRGSVFLCSWSGQNCGIQ